MEYREITRINPLDPVIMDTLFSYLKADCPDYVDLDRQVFDDCDIYIFTLIKDPIQRARGIIGIRRTTKDKLDVDNLEFYCQSNNVMYCIEFIHVFDMFSPENRVKAFTRMIEVAIASRNDGFTFFVPKCPVVHGDAIHTALIENNFKYYPYMKEKDVHCMFMRTPLTNRNPNIDEMIII